MPCLKLNLQLQVNLHNNNKNNNNIIIIISFMHGIYTYIPETNYVPRELQCCSYSVVTIHVAYIVSFSVGSIVLLH